MANLENKIENLFLVSIITALIILFCGKIFFNYLENFSLKPEQIVIFRELSETRSYFCALRIDKKHLFCHDWMLHYACTRKNDLNRLKNSWESGEKTNFFKIFGNSECLVFYANDRSLGGKKILLKILHLEGKYVELEVVNFPSNSLWTYKNWVKKAN